MPNPDLIPEPFAQDGDKNPIPLERAIADPVYRASWKAGFPPDTRLPKDLGGEAPDGLDFNGVLNILSQAVVFLQKGNAYQFDPALAPYPIGALVRSNDNLTTYQSTVPNNSNNPNSNMTGWRVYNSSSFVVDNLTTNDSAKALSAAQGKVLKDSKIETTARGTANGVASLDVSTKVPVVQLPAATISDAGVLRFATAAEVANRTNINAAITPTNVGQTFGQSLSTNGWCRLPNGMIMQWGVSNDLTITFPIAFSSACLNVQATLKEAVAFQANYSGFHIATMTTTGATITINGQYNAADFYYSAIGY